MTVHPYMGEAPPMARYHDSSPQVPSSLSWHPRGDALLIAGEGGSVGMWEHAVPQGQELPSAWRTRDEVEREADAAAVAGGWGNVCVEGSGATVRQAPGRPRSCPAPRGQGMMFVGSRRWPQWQVVGGAVSCLAF